MLFVVVQMVFLPKDLGNNAALRLSEHMAALGGRIEKAPLGSNLMLRGALLVGKQAWIDIEARAAIVVPPLSTVVSWALVVMLLTGRPSSPSWIC
jgi:hypothetical protein